jgi:hypothetical protein
MFERNLSILQNTPYLKYSQWLALFSRSFIQYLSYVIT